MPTPLEIAVAALREIYEAGPQIGFPFAGTAKRALQAIEGAPPQTGGELEQGNQYKPQSDQGASAKIGPEGNQSPQTGGGDAGERARDPSQRQFGFRDGMRRAIKWLHDRATWSSHREGAEAAREADVRACEERSAWAEAKIADDARDDARDDDYDWATYSNACDDCAEIVGALPIPDQAGIKLGAKLMREARASPSR